jgi:nitroreductase
MDFYGLLDARRSVREFEDRQVPPETIRQILADGCRAPSAANDQPWEFVVVCDSGLMKRMSDESKANILERIRQEPQGPLRKYRGVLKIEGLNVFYDAPCLVLVVGNRNHRTLLVDCALCACHIMFSATARGLGTCWVDLGSDIRNPELRRELGLTDDYLIVAPIIMGYPKKIHQQVKKRGPQILKWICCEGKECG